MGRNVLGYIEGCDPEMKKEAVMFSAHLDHLGLNHLLMPGANDNASGVAVILGVAEAIHKSGIKPKCSIIFSFFGAEEQGVKGSEYYLQHPFIANEKLIGLINLDGVGRGNDISTLAGKNYPDLYRYIEEANKKYIHRVLNPVLFHNRARPRLDAAHFMWAGVPTLSFAVDGAQPLPYETYHTTHDNPEIITPEIMEDLGQLLFIAVMEIVK
ncbi:MAG: M20/M25/M40 family metallo-hydrolase [Acidobacteria bacterium]|nr:M20/M25/M40 family metallo-hydrolase [Acidobacteriota bacterium]